MDKFTFIKNLQTLASVIEVPLEEIAVGGSGWFVLIGASNEAKDLNVWIPEKYLERLAKNEGTYYPKGSSRQTVASWFVPVAVGEVTAWIRAQDTFYETEKLPVSIFRSSAQDSIDTTITILDPLAMMIEKRSSYSAVKRPKEKRTQDFEDIQLLQAVLRSRSDKRLLKAG